MLNLQTVLVCVGVVLILLVAYRFLFNPQVLLGGIHSEGTTCPTHWKYIDGLCKPSYETSCMPFDPFVITSKVSGCNLARTCGTDWPGKCV
uniref:CPW-WPC domain-containing protein n=1 Tax=viral metagenome TaxID=1070528 RepID=A0A6C0JIL7_9ZZZZ